MFSQLAKIHSGVRKVLNKIMNNEISIIDVEEHVKNSPEYLSLPKKILINK